MTITPEFGEEERMNLQQRRVREGSESVRQDHEDIDEHEIDEHLRDERGSAYLEAEDNEAHAPGAVCERCDAIITASQDARRLPDGNWVHEACPRADGRITT